MNSSETLMGQYPLFQSQDQQVQNVSSVSNQEEAEARRFSRRDYNKQYYQANKPRIYKKRKGRSNMKVLLFSKDKAVEASSKTVSEVAFHWVELLVFVLLTVVMTQYLIRESAVFYLEARESLVSAYAKAAMVEGMAILFSFSRGKGTFLRWAQRLLVVLLCSLTLFTMSCKLYRTTVQGSSSYRITAQTVKDLEAEQEEKSQLRKTLLNREWLGATRKSDQDLLQVRQRLAEARQKLESMEAPDVAMGGFWILIIFRVLVVAGNLIAIHRIVELIAGETVQKEEKLAPSGTEFALKST